MVYYTMHDRETGNTGLSMPRRNVGIFLYMYKMHPLGFINFTMYLYFK